MPPHRSTSPPVTSSAAPYITFLSPSVFLFSLSLWFDSPSHVHAHAGRRHGRPGAIWHGREEEPHAAAWLCHRNGPSPTATAGSGLPLSVHASGDANHR